MKKTMLLLIVLFVSFGLFATNNKKVIGTFSVGSGITSGSEIGALGLSMGILIPVNNFVTTGVYVGFGLNRNAIYGNHKGQSFGFTLGLRTLVGNIEKKTKTRHEFVFDMTFGTIDVGLFYEDTEKSVFGFSILPGYKFSNEQGLSVIIQGGFSIATGNDWYSGQQITPAASITIGKSY